MSAKDPIRQQLIQARRNQILDAAAQVFAEKSFHRASTKEIASTAGVSEGTIYNYFASKSDLLIGIMTRLAELESLDEELMEALQGDAREFFVATFRYRIGRIQQGQEMLQAILPEVLTNPELREQFYQQYVLRIATMIEQYVRAQIELGHMRPVDVPLTVRAIQSTFVGMIVLRILGDEPLQSRWDDVPEILATLLFDGLKPGEVI
ncbi:MAG: TetR/AcrR family transcriptional regulator [Chloroflexi bacterium]|nr:TetR/AcrR family transcriptional regulator [Chloroflexota bacterium]